MAKSNKKRVDEVCLGARHYTIEWNAEKADDLAADIGDPSDHAYGVCVHNDRTIVLNPDVHGTADTVLETFLHEAFHVVEPFIGVKISHRVIDALANATASMLIQSGIVDTSELVIAGRCLDDFQGLPEEE